MKRWILLILALLAFFSAFAQRTERVWLVPDRDWYAAGERVYLSAFCLDISQGVSLSSVSAIAYVELASADGFAIGSKIALVEGRGAGSLVLPRTLPSGNYRLSAYTALSDAHVASRTLSVYNTLSTARVKKGVTVGEMPADVIRPSTSQLQAETLPDGSVRLHALEDARVAVSVYRNEPFPSYGGTSLEDLLKAPAGARPAQAVPEYDGEILTLHLSKSDGSPLDGLSTSEVLVSRPGHVGDIYSSNLQPDGTVRFYTFNCFGEGELVVTLKKDAPAFKAELQSPFRELPAGEVPALVLDPSQKEALTRLGARMQVTSAFEADTLYQKLPVREIPFLSDNRIRYVLDDYTRFATFREVFVEYLFDIRTRGKGEDLEMQIRCRDREKGVPSFREQPSLILVDGVPVTHHELIYNMDPALVKTVDIYPYYYTLGNAVFSGVAHFITKKGDMGGIRFGDNVRILDYSGAAYPVAFSTPSEDLRYPSQRETLLWQPLVELQAGEELVLPALQAEEGMVLVAEGLTESGDPVLVTKVL